MQNFENMKESSCFRIIIFYCFKMEIFLKKMQTKVIRKSNS